MARQTNATDWGFYRQLVGTATAAFRRVDGSLGFPSATHGSLPDNKVPLLQSGEAQESPIEVTHKNSSPFAEHRKKTSMRTMELPMSKSGMRNRRRSQKESHFIWGVVSVISQERRVWFDLVGVTFLYFHSIAVPLALGFVHEPRGYLNGVILIVGLLASFFWSIDICVNFLTSYRDEDHQLVTDLTKIRNRYLTGYFVMDLIGSFPWEFLVFSSSFWVRMCRVLRGAKGVRWSSYASLETKLIQKAEETDFVTFFVRIWKLQVALECAKLSWLIYQLAHVNASGFWLIGRYSYELGHEPWISDYYIDGKSNGQQYLDAMYWSICTLTTTGYGDMVPITSLGRLWFCVMMLVAPIVFTYFVARAATLATRLIDEATHVDKSVAQIRGYLRRAHVSEDLRTRVDEYLHQWHLVVRSEEVDSFLQRNLPKALVEDISMELFAPGLTAFPFFDLLPDHVIRALCLKCKKHFYGEGDRVISAGSVNRSILFLISGSLEVMVENLAIVETIIAPAYFGAENIFADHVTNVEVAASTFSELVELQRNDVLEILDGLDDRTVSENFLMLEEMIAQENFDAFQKYCGSDGFAHPGKYCNALRMSAAARDSDMIGHREAPWII